MKRKSKRSYFNNFFTKNFNNSRKTWIGINKLINKNKHHQKIIYLDSNGLITDQTKVANTFNQYFVRVGDNLSSKITNKNTKFQDYLKNPNKSSLFLKETTPDEIQLIINDLDEKKVLTFTMFLPNLLNLLEKLFPIYLQLFSINQ